MKRIGTALVTAAVMAVLGTAWANDAGTEEEARAMLGRAIAALKQDEAAALAAFTAGAPGFKEKDLYVFCVDPNGVVTANGGHPDHIGLDTHTEIDAQGKNIGAAILAAARPGEINTATYLYPKPGSTEPVLKYALISRVKDQICGVGYYAEQRNDAGDLSRRAPAVSSYGPRPQDHPRRGRLRPVVANF